MRAPSWPAEEPSSAPMVIVSTSAPKRSESGSSTSRPTNDRRWRPRLSPLGIRSRNVRVILRAAHDLQVEAGAHAVAGAHAPRQVDRAQERLVQPAVEPHPAANSVTCSARGL